MVSWRMHLRMSNSAARFCFASTVSAWRLSSALNFLKVSSNSSDSSEPALGRGKKSESENERKRKKNENEERTKRRGCVQFESLVTVVVLVVHGGGVAHGQQNAADHEAHVDALHAEVVVDHGHVREHHARQNVTRLLGLDVNGNTRGHRVSQT